MTTPVDPRPYAGPTDLVTAEDAARWLDTYPWTWPVDYARAELRARLDRERRQACRRGALDRWRAFSMAVREYARQKRDEGLICDSEAEYYIERYLSDALAFRAAARQP